MKEIEINIEIDEDGKVFAETKGIKGESCIDELEQLMDDIAQIKEIEKTDEYYEKGRVTRKTSVNRVKENKLRRR